MSPRQRPVWLRWLERALWVGGALAILWVAWGWLDARVYQAREEHQLEQALLHGSPAPAPATAPQADGIPADEVAPGGARHEATTAAGDATTGSPVTTDEESAAPHDRPATVTAVRSAPPVKRASAARPSAVPVAAVTLAHLSIPRVHIGVMIASDVDHASLRRAVGHIPGTAPLGSAGNVGIAGHRDTFFRPLKDVRIGDEVLLTTPRAITRYRVEWAEVMSADDAAPLGPTNYSSLTLVTCYPFYYVGNAPDRFVVRARLVDSHAPTAADARRLLSSR